MKRVLEEPHADDLSERLIELESGANELITSTLGWVEVTRALKRLGGEPIGDLDAKALSGISGFPISYEVISLARRIGPQVLRSLDAIHCATATLADADLLVTYDERLQKSAEALGIAVECPGVNR